jgi:alanyl-tRNA synthetase
LKVGDKVDVSIDYQRRALVAPNHTCTHVLNFALLKVMGKGLDQMGSLVDEDKLRFDFSFNRALTAQEVSQVEKIVNDQIQVSQLEDLYFLC